MDMLLSFLFQLFKLGTTVFYVYVEDWSAGRVAYNFASLLLIMHMNGFVVFFICKLFITCRIQYLYLKF